MKLLTSNQKSRGWFGIAIGDSYGAGPEMKSHEHIISDEYFNTLDRGYILRDPEHGIGAKAGDYTDDFEMSIGVWKALNENEELTLNTLCKCWNKVYQENKKAKGGIARSGYGSWKNVAEANDTEMVNIWKDQRIRQATKSPGNAPNMRQFPIVMYSKNKAQLYRNTIKNVLASHPHPLAIISCISLAAANYYLIYENGAPVSVIVYVIEELCNLVEELQNTTILRDDEVYGKLHFQTQQETFKYFIEKLRKIELLPEVKDVKCEMVNFDLLAGMHTSGGSEDGKISFAKPLNGGTGLSAKAEQTSYSALFFLKWSGNASIYDNLKRTICFGGDTDSLACIVLPTLMVTRDLDKSLIEIFPSWVIEDLEAFDFLQRFT